MPDFDDTQLTQAVLDSFAGAPDPRTRAVLTRLISHLHAFVRDTELTFDEWRAAIDFLTRTGHTSNATRQEFILLSDVLGVSMLVDAIHSRHRDHAGATASTVLGPFYVGDHRLAPHGTDLAPGAPGDRLIVDVQVTDTAGQPIRGAEVDVWHADGDGLYDSQQPGYTLDTPAMRARFAAGDDGRATFRTIVPRSYPVPTDGPVGELLRAGNRHAMRPAHIHFLIRAAGFATLVTHVFAAGDDYLASDAVFGVKPSLIAPLTPVAAPDEPAPPPGADGTTAPARWYRLTYRFALTPEPPRPTKEPA
jgi:protocatechuate 3,4-dioxygenase beta subunit